MIIFISILVFISATALSVLLLGSFLRTVRAAKSAETSDPPSMLDDLPGVRPVVHFFAYLSARAGLVRYFGQLERRMRWAGHPGGQLSPEMFLGMAETLAFSVFLLIFLLLMYGGFPWFAAGALALAFAGMGAYTPFSWLAAKLHERTKLINRAFPYFLDLVVMAMGAGATFLEAVQIYVNDNTGQPLADELRIVLRDIEMGKPRREALMRMLARVRSDDVENSIRTVIQGEEMGTPLHQTLSQQSESIRFKRSQRAERIAEEIKVRIQGPVVLLMAAIFLLILGPAIVQILTSEIM